MTVTVEDKDYICLTDMARNTENRLALIEKWLRNKNTTASTPTPSVRTSFRKKSPQQAPRIYAGEADVLNIVIQQMRILEDVNKKYLK
ncbi:KilA-N domain-containing protein [Bacteroides fragilis]|uniref:KilA-N domain-containing protein n=1 Tax=Bacteroides fragilis TaxID=817 RepID=UPI00030C1E46|nr:KilA-N domain-containing protein [Bacteroides fragilis]MCS2759235.1 KilA-N domain-containing protein [Bacteroides fragilis]MCZ2550738.1 KilA-N domain-containing protein [Bacteroides fragilis]OCR31027.1 hypothetical protein AC140_27190 [Bacteroides fragilis]UVP06270.1 KilA-N domain-containing protein [Bacteroides fragilis]UVP97565.1 KilA-N domain-containing protein [Bacteroides fragilis]